MSARRYRFRRDESAAEGVRRVVAGRLEKAAGRLQSPGEGDALAATVHGARKDLKKARAALRLARGGLARKDRRKANKRLAKAGRLLSGSRDAEVKLATLDALAAGDPEVPFLALRTWREALADERAADIEVDERVAAARWQIEAALAAVPGWRIRGTGWGLLGPGLERSYREGRRALRRLDADAEPDAVHAWRKRVKDLWYHLRLLEAAWPGLLGPTVELLDELGERLGDHHDLALLAADLGERSQLGANAAIFARLIDRRQAELLTEALALGARLYGEKPSAFNRRARSYWRVWRSG